MNSIQAFLDSHSENKVSEVRLVLNHGQTGRRILVLVEGADDEAFYQAYLNTQKVFVYALNGCEHFNRILTELNPHYPGRFLVIKDADFDHLNGITYTYPNLLLTDQHDYEMMMMTPDRVKKVAKEYGIDDENAARIYEKIVNNISNFSYIKWYNSKRNEGTKGINFKSAKAVNYYGKSIEEAVNLLRPSQNPEVILDPVAIESLKLANEHIDRRQLINGHDFCELIPKAIKDIKRQNIRNKDIPSKLISYFSTSDFLHTHLAASLERLIPGVCTTIATAGSDTSPMRLP